MTRHKPQVGTTPRTDATEYKLWTAANDGMGDEYAERVVPVDFARELELELNAALAEAEKARTCRHEYDD